MPWVQTEATERLTPPDGLPGLGPEDWVEIRTVYTAAMRRSLVNKSMPMRMADATVVSDGLDIFAYRQALIEAVVVAWSDETPVTPEALAQLHPKVQDWLEQEFERLSGGPSEREKKEHS